MEVSGIMSKNLCKALKYSNEDIRRAAFVKIAAGSSGIFGNMGKTPVGAILGSTAGAGLGALKTYVLDDLIRNQSPTAQDYVGNMLLGSAFGGATGAVAGHVLDSINMRKASDAVVNEVQQNRQKINEQFNDMMNKLKETNEAYTKVNPDLYENLEELDKIPRDFKGFSDYMNGLTDLDDAIPVEFEKMTKGAGFIEKTASDIRRLAIIKMACYRAGYDINRLSHGDMEKIAAIHWPNIWGSVRNIGSKGINTVKQFGGDLYNSVKGEGGQLINGIKQIPKILRVTAKSPRFAGRAAYKTLAETNFGNIGNNAMPNMIIDQMAGGSGSPIDYLEIMRFLNRLGNNMNSYNEYMNIR